MSSHSITIELPEPILQESNRLAKQSKRTPEELAALSIVGNLPPTVENAPEEIQSELLAMQSLPVDVLIQVGRSQIDAAQWQRHEELLEKNSEGMLSEAEQKELRGLRRKADQFVLKKAYAWAVLRWRGYPVPTIDELPLE